MAGKAPFHTPAGDRGVDAGRVVLEPVRAEPTQRVTHLTYTVRRGD